MATVDFCCLMHCHCLPTPQVRQLHLPVPDSLLTDETGTASQEEAESSVQLSLGRAAAFFKLLRPSLSFGKPKHSEIHSAKISEDERQKTLAPFELPGIAATRVNRDYEAFFRTSAWGDSGGPGFREDALRGGGVPKPQKPRDLPVGQSRGERGAGRGFKEDGGAGRGGGEEGNHSPVAQRKQKKLPLVPPTSQLSPPETPANRLPSPLRSRHTSLHKKPSAPMPAPKPAHGKLQATTSVDPQLSRPKPRGKCYA